MIHVFTLRKCSLVLKKEEEEGKGEGGGLQWGREARHEPIPEPGSRSCFRKVLFLFCVLVFGKEAYEI